MSHNIIFNKTSIQKVIIRQWEVKQSRNWDKWYWFVDIHDCVLKANYSLDLAAEWIKGAKEVLQRLSNNQSIVLCLWTCSHTTEIQKYLEFFEQNGIHFDYTNENPEAYSNSYGNYEKKPYYNVLIDDKCQFIDDEFWQEVDLALDYVEFLEFKQNNNFTA